MTQVKICGITNLNDAQVAVEAGADMIGLNFYPPSPRYVTLEQAKTIVEYLPPEVLAVGVFVNETAETMMHVADVSGVKKVQLHGDEAPSVCAALSLPVIKVFRFTEHVRPEMMADYTTVDAFFVEGFNEKLYGGSGTVADWQHVATLHDYGRIILAGGLTPDNVQQAIRVVQPYAVDVASGVEASPGHKDPQKVRAFVQRAKAAI
ncbi:MAG: N-(5'-phosphoribosyl)anthranilate isomerase [Candidatus Entotheonella factor]|uniref:N-(5'-phosphoribosyl)anthranilate isomerase n=1 Tax=Entotheonella factor TaxID=1429438 RepID=W4LQ46_ENTF1|nr:phosphoribosylanthranilate isomerase [Candidatus Entotheonella palauensis]ETW99835.1 MAG: N-(5'-phosphoribosyl)anthranilate isomerase [Candidatus Entotheonella factor]